ncbi:replication initiation protein [uncultured Cetobacterium sp.]|uniref:replication initiation protein n=1 Tax=uncultured Cetobacterium sp. TaxID=527638 RepID=UPI00261E5EAA|nr:replication initiation protein [uncultured Cetobacterium sp.]
MKNLELYKPNQLIEIVGNPISTKGIMAYNFLIHKFQTLKTDRLTISMSEIFNSLDISDDYEELYNYLDSLQKIRVESRDSRGRIWGAFNLLAVFQKRNEGVFVQIPDPIFKVLCTNYGNEKEKELYYTTIRLLEQRAFKCSYTIIFYEIFKKFTKVNLPKYTLDELRAISGTTEKYKIYADFKKRVLSSALKELNNFDSQYEYSFEEKRLGRKINEIKFIRIEKNILDVTPEPQISEKLSKAITKARKSRFVDSSYSQKAMDKIISMYDEKDIIKALGELYKYNSEILNFQKMLISKIDDVKRSKMPLKTISKTKHIPTTKNDCNEFKDTIRSFDRGKIDISKEDYEELYILYLESLKETHNPYIRKSFDIVNKHKYKIID